MISQYICFNITLYSKKCVATKTKYVAQEDGGYKTKFENIISEVKNEQKNKIKLTIEDFD